MPVPNFANFNFQFIGWAALDIIWIVYGLVHKEPPIVMTYTFWFVINLTVAFGAILYG